MSDFIHRCLVALACITCIAGVVACGGPSTNYEAVWGRRADLSSMRRVAVVYESPDGALRRNVEDTMTRKLVSRGIRAMPSYNALTPDEMKDPATAKAALTAKGFDGLVEIRFIGKEQEQSGPYYMNTYDGWGYWGSPYGWNNYYYSDWTTSVRVETSLYSLQDGELLWSARSKTSDADDMSEVVDEVTTLVASTLERRGMPGTQTARR